MSGSSPGNAASTPDFSWYTNLVFLTVKSFPFVDTATVWPRRLSAGVGLAAGATHCTLFALFQTPLVVTVPILHFKRFVFAKFFPSTVTTVPPAEFPERGCTDLDAGTGAYVNSTADPPELGKVFCSPFETSTDTGPSSNTKGASHFIKVLEIKYVLYPTPEPKWSPPNPQVDHGLKSSPCTSKDVPRQPYLGVTLFTAPAFTYWYPSPAVWQFDVSLFSANSTCTHPSLWGGEGQVTVSSSMNVAGLSTPSTLHSTNTPEMKRTSARLDPLSVRVSPPTVVPSIGYIHSTSGTS